MKPIKPIETCLQVCANWGLIPTEFRQCMTWEEQVLWLSKFLNTVVLPKMNETIDATNELREAFEVLKEYVDNYFDNLDVQEEINNKLDDMAESGELAQIIIEALSDNFQYQEITTTEYFNQAKNTKYWITHIPHLDSDGEIIALQHGLANDVSDFNLSASETPRNFAKRTGATICVNASRFQNTDPESASYNHPVGPIIRNGVLVCNYTPEPGLPLQILGIQSDNTLKCYDINTTPEVLLADGVYNTVVGFDQLITNGVITSAYSDTYNYQWNIIGQNSITKDIYLFECEGKDIFGATGMSIPEACTILLNLGCNFAYRLDQGGSIAICKNAVQLNQPTDDYGTSERNVPDFIYFGKPVTTDFDKSIQNADNAISDSSMLAMINKATTYYLESIDNNVLAFNKSIKNPTLNGLYLQYKNNNVANSTLILNKSLNVYDNENNITIASVDGTNSNLSVGSSSDNKRINITGEVGGNSTVQVANKSLIFNDHQLNLYDHAAGTTKIRLDSTTEKITIGTKTIGSVYEKTGELAATTDFNTLQNTGFYFVNYTSGQGTNRPFEKAAFLIVTSPYNNMCVQLAFPASGDTSVKPRYRINNGGTWTAWLTL